MGLHVLPRSGAPAGLAGGFAQSAGWFGGCGWSTCGSYAFEAVRTDWALLIPASARLYAETRFFDCAEACWFDVVDSTTVTTDMLSMTITPSANTSAKRSEEHTSELQS